MTRSLVLAAAPTLACDAGVTGVRDWTRAAGADTASAEVTGSTVPSRSWVTANADRAWLEALYEATDGDNWKRRDNWLTDAPAGRMARRPDRRRRSRDRALDVRQRSAGRDPAGDRLPWAA